MAIIRMVVKVMLNSINKILLAIFVFFCTFFYYGNVFAVNYGSGLYNAGLYSDTAPSTPTSSPVAGLYNSTQSVTLSATGSTSIRYSTTSTPADCSSGTLYTDPISVAVSETIYTRVCNIYNNSSIASFTYTIDTTAPSTPTSSPVVGLYNSTQSVTLDSTGSDYIKYSTSSLPTNCSSGTSYAGPISVSTSQTIYVRACDNAGNSSTTSFAYVIDTTAPLTPSALPVSGIYNSTQSVTLSATGSTSIRYSTTSTPADCSSGTLYTDPISVATSQTIYVLSCDDAGNSSSANFDYIISIHHPSISSGYISSLYLNNLIPPIQSSVISPVTHSEILNVKKVTKNLKLGMTNKDVKTLQLFLIQQDKGLNAKALKKNGTTNYFGKMTKLALIEWQKKSKLTPDGIFGLKTRAKIKTL